MSDKGRAIQALIRHSSSFIFGIRHPLILQSIVRGVSRSVPVSVASLLLILWFSPVSCLICNQRGAMDARERAYYLSKLLDRDESH
ncbi:MAG TPA: hypothetical protein VGC89_04000 [Pyrinomonadaceae bacterium]